LAFAAGGGPKVMRGLSGRAAIRGFAIDNSGGAIGDGVFAGLAWRAAIRGNAVGRKSATPGSGGPEGAAADSMTPSLSRSPKPVVRIAKTVDAVQRISGEKSTAPCRASARVPFCAPRT
jgi:hypothetical protein